jgi:GntR family transcriptional regulator
MLYYNSMRVRLTPSSGVSIYRQIVDQVGDQIACGRLQAGDRLPSVRELARALPANQNTVIKAYEVLERDGLITRRHGDGTFVAGGGSLLSAADRRRILADLLGHAALKAQLFGITPDELHQLLKQQIAALPQPKENARG